MQLRRSSREMARRPYFTSQNRDCIGKAKRSGGGKAHTTPMQIQRIAQSVVPPLRAAGAFTQRGRGAGYGEAPDHGPWRFEVAKAYITYRYTRTLVRQSNTTDDKILSLIECNNEEAKQENANKNPVVNSHPAGLYGGRGLPRYYKPHLCCRRRS